MKYAIYGAQGYALGAFKAITTLYPEKKVECFLVTEMGNNASNLAGLPVWELKDYERGMDSKDKDVLVIYIATPENVQTQIEETLLEHRFNQYIKLDYEKWSALMDEYNAKTRAFLPLREITKGKDTAAIEVFIAKSGKDKPLQKTFLLPDYVHELQVGTAIYDGVETEHKDNTGENISAKNGNYCELTGLYWLWKNAILEDDRYYGFFQYRRLFDLSEEDLARLGSREIDVLLPYPLPYEPDIHEHHKRYIKDNDWEAMTQALKEVHPDYVDAFRRVLSQEYLYNYNVIVAKGQALREYCQWLFPILERTEELSTPKGKDRADRYIGYMGETLETLYFMANVDKYRIAHSACRMLL